MLILAKYSLGVGDRFAREAKAQLRACLLAAEQGVAVVPIWNKSHREHRTVRSRPDSVRIAADEAVRELNWPHSYHVDADHIGMETVDGYLDSCDFFTLDVADSIDRPCKPEAIAAFAARHPELTDVEQAAGKYLRAIEEAGRIYRHVAAAKGVETFITEVSMDETGLPQTPSELLVILAGLADEGVPLQTIAPKFTGRFNKGVDYVGDLAQFEREFRDDLAVLAFARDHYGLPESLKLSVHSGSDKFSLYPIMRRALRDFDAGVHLKTAGTTWLEEIIGLAEASGEGRALAQEIYRQALKEREALCAPYAAVIDIDSNELPSAEEVRRWSSSQFADAIRHDPHSPYFNPSMRQLLHVAYGIAARMGDRYLRMLDEYAPTIAENVTANLYERHIKPLFIGETE